MVLTILSLVTRPSSVRRVLRDSVMGVSGSLPCSSARARAAQAELALLEDGVDARHGAADLRQARGAGQALHRRLEAQVEELAAQLLRVVLQLVVGLAADLLDLHGWARGLRCWAGA